MRPERSHNRRTGYAITNGPQALRRKDGDWKLWVRVINFDDLSGDIHATIEVSTDRGFSQIVDRIPVTLRQKKSFISQVHYHPSAPNSTLFFRYVIDDQRRDVSAVSAVVNSISPWTDESKPE